MMKKVSQIFLAGILLCIAVYIGVFIGRTGAKDILTLPKNDRNFYNDSSSSETSRKINLNTATADDLSDIPDVGLSVAKAIIQYRDEYGKYYKVSELKYINGITDELYEIIIKYVTVDD